MSIRNESIFPRDPNGNRDNSIVKANEQLTQAFSDSPSTNGPAKGSSFILNALLKLITQLIMLLENRETPSKPDSKKEVPSKPEIVMEKEKSEPGKTKPQNGGEGARGVYGGAIGWNGPTQEKETPSKLEPEIEKEKPEPKKLKPQNGGEGARGVYGGAIGWNGPAQEKETPSKPEPEIEKEKPEPEKLKPQIGEEGARGVYGGAIGWTGSVQEK